MSFRGRLVAAVSFVTAVTLGGAFAVVSTLVNRDQQQQLDQALRREALEEAREVAALGGHQLAISGRPGPAANDVGPLTKYGAIYDSDGTVQAATPTFSGQPPARTVLGTPKGHCFNLWFRGEHLRGILMPIPSHPGLELLLAAPRTDLDSDAAFLARAMGMVWIVAILWASLVASWIIRRLTHRHQTIAEVVRRVASGDRAARITGLSRDTEVAQLERDINDMIGRISALLESQQRFIAHAAHELRSPLSSLLGELSHALRRPRDAEGYRQAIEEALDSTRRLKLLTEDLLALARLGAVPPDAAETVEALSIAHTAARDAETEARERGVEIRVDGQTGTLQGRPRDLERMLRNLIENAVRHSAPASLVHVQVDEKEADVLLWVADCGPGIPPSERERIFEPFYRGPRERAQGLPGAGLGLAISREIARAHGGDITLVPQEEPSGSKFLIRLPVSLPSQKRDRA